MSLYKVSAVIFALIILAGCDSTTVVTDVTVAALRTSASNQTLTVENTGSCTITDIAPALSPSLAPYVNITNNCASSSLKKGESCTVTLQNSGASDPQTQTGSITFNWNRHCPSNTPTGDSNYILSVVEATYLYAGAIGQGGAGYLTKWDGVSWTDVGSGVINGPVDALTVMNGNLYVGGLFTTTGGTALKNIAMWDGNSWSSLDGGVDNVVTALTNDGTKIYAGGQFLTAIDGTSLKGIGAFDGTSWSSLAGGLNGSVSALAYTGGVLYAGGDFTTSDSDVVLNNIGAYNDSTWTALGSGLNLTVAGLTVEGTTLYAGGEFTSSGATTLNGIGSWTGSWAALGTPAGVSGRVDALCTMGSDIYFGGDVPRAMSPGLTLNNVGLWNGSAFVALNDGSGPGVNSTGYVYACTSSTDTVYIGGAFTSNHSDSTSLNNIAGWDPNNNTWIQLGFGVSSQVNALAIGSYLSVGSN